MITMTWPAGYCFRFTLLHVSSLQRCPSLCMETPSQTISHPDPVLIIICCMPCLDTTLLCIIPLLAVNSYPLYHVLRAIHSQHLMPFLYLNHFSRQNLIAVLLVFWPKECAFERYHHDFMSMIQHNYIEKIPSKPESAFVQTILLHLGKIYGTDKHYKVDEWCDNNCVVDTASETFLYYLFTISF